MKLKISTKETKQGIIIISPIGTIDTDSSRILDEEIEKFITSETKTLVLEMEGVDYITSAGIGVITKAKALLKQVDGDIAMINLKPQVKKVFEILRLLPSLNIFANIEELDEYIGKIQQQMLDGDKF